MSDFDNWVSKIDSLIKKGTPDDLHKATKSLIKLNWSLKDLNPRFLTDREVFSKLLDWYYVFCKKQAQPFPVWDETVNGIALVTSPVLLILEKAMNLAFTERLRLGDEFFDLLDEHFEKHKKDELYMKCVTNIFFVSLVKRVKDNRELHDWWPYYFPKNWEITTRNLQDSKNVTVGIMWWHYRRWATGRIENGESRGLDEALDIVTHYLIPEVDPNTWAKLLVLIYPPYEAMENRVVYAIKTKPTFGIAQRPYGNISPPGFRRWETLDQERRATFELALYSFPHFFTIPTLEKFAFDLAEIKNITARDEEIRLRAYREIFDDMLAILAPR